MIRRRHESHPIPAPPPAEPWQDGATMKTVAIVSQKGGAGKTTLALHIAVAAEAAGYPAAIMDMDAQGTAEAWGTWRSEAPPIVLAAKATTLARRLEQAAQAGAGVAVIDTPPIAEAEARAAVTAADLVLIPCRPNAFDLHAIRSTAGLVSYAGKKAFLVFNGGPPRAPALYADTTELVREFGLEVCPVILPDRAAFRHATGTGHAAQEYEPDGKAAEEVARLWEWVANQFNTPARSRTSARKG
jgi:chromosome partitioning protein